MKNLAVVYLRRAKQDLVEIRDYIKKDNPSQARAWVEKIDKTLGRLARFPESGAIPKDDHLAALGYRMVIIGDYLAFYLQRRRRIEIRRVLHGSRRYSFLLSPKGSAGT